jgi:hypothetical protein
MNQRSASLPCKDGVRAWKININICSPWILNDGNHGQSSPFSMAITVRETVMGLRAILIAIERIGIETAKYASHQLLSHLLTAFNHMLDEQHKAGVTLQTPIRSSDLDRTLFHAAIKEAYFQLDQDLKKAVNDQSGAVCVCLFFHSDRLYSSSSSTDHLSHQS